jgi:hypothetical protein
MYSLFGLLSVDGIEVLFIVIFDFFLNLKDICYHEVNKLNLLFN